jgi:hypothetical protein
MQLPPKCISAAVVLGLTGVWLGLAAEPAGAQGPPPVDEFIAMCVAAPDNPYLVTTCFPQGTRGEDDAAVVAFNDTADDSGHVALATARQVGATYGLAYHGRDEMLYVGAYHKRGTHFGPSGPGGIYAIDLRSGEVSTFAVVPNAGADTHDPAGDYFPDLSGRFGAGTTSLGDLDLNEGGTELTVVNLNDRRIYRYSVPDGALLGSFAHGAAAESWAVDARPFGLGFRNGKLFHGVIRTAQSTQDPDELRAVVYESEPDGSALREVASTGLRYDRGLFWPDEGQAIWQPWLDPPGTVFPGKGRFAMPMFADIDFTEDGTQMILGLRDRFGDNTFYTTPPNTPPAGEYVYNVPAGDILPGWPEGDRWRIQVDPEYYRGDYGPDRTGTHDETSFGGLAVLPDGDTVAMTSNSPIEISSAGAVWLSITTGDDTRREEIYQFGQGDNFGKANGLGDMEVLCDTLQQPTETPTASATSTATASQPATNTATQPATLTSVPSATSTPRPTITPTPLPSATLPPGVTPSSPPDDRPDATSPPGAAATPELPGLPKTGFGAEGGPRGWVAGLLLLIGLGAVACACAMWWQRRREAA